MNCPYYAGFGYNSPAMVPAIIGRYRIRSELGRGGMAVVYHAYDPFVKRPVAVKVLPREVLHDPDSRARFDEEAQLIAAFEHPAIVPVYDYGEEDEQPYLVMQLMTGGALDQRLCKGALPLDEAARILSHIAPALDEAHAKGLIHRDLKPGNILFDQRDDPHIADFGIARLTAGRGGPAAQDGRIRGTPAYMSPEQAAGDPKLDGRSDIYSLGVILYEMLTGALPFTADTPGVGTAPEAAPPARTPAAQSLPESCEGVVRRATAAEREQRYGSAVELALAVVAAAEAERLPVVPVRPAPTVVSTAERGGQGARQLTSFLSEWGIWIAMSVVLMVAMCAASLSAFSLLVGPLPWAATPVAVSTDGPSGVALTAAGSRSTAGFVLTSTGVSTGEAESLKAVISVNQANVRSGPGTGYAILASYPRSTELVVQGRNLEGTWLAVITPEGGLAWVSVQVVAVPVEILDIDVYK